MSQTIECLLVGGPADGQRVSMQCHWNPFEQSYVPQEFVNMDTSPELDMRSMPTLTPEPLPIQRTTYIRQMFRERDQTFWIFMPFGSQNSIMASLIAGYRQGGEA